MRRWILTVVRHGADLTRRGMKIFATKALRHQGFMYKETFCVPLCLRALVAIFTAVFATGLWGDAVLRGRITQQSSGGVPVVHVQVSAFGANPVTSTGSGLFELTFPGKAPGDVVVLILQKTGYEVVNKKDLERVILRKNPDELIEVSMCPSGKWEENVQIFYGIAAKSITDSFAERLKKLETAVLAGKEKDLEIRRLMEERDAALAQAKKIAEEFAYVNLDEASALYKEAFAHFQKGEIDRSLAVLNDAKLEQALKNVASLEEKTRNTRKQVAEDYRLKARLSIIKLRFEEAERYYEKVVEADPGKPGQYLEFSAFLWRQDKFQKGREVCEKGLSLARDDGDRAGFLNNLGLIFSDTGLFVEAEKTYREALGIYRKLADTNSNSAVYLPKVAITLNNLGVLYADTTRLTEAEQAYQEALGIRRKLVDTTSAGYLPDVAATLNNLGNLYYKTTRFGEAEQTYREALGIYRQLEDTTPMIYQPYVATTLNNLGLLYADTTRFIEAEQTYQEALGIRRKLAKTNPAAYRPDVAATLNNLGNLYAETTRLVEAEQVYKEALGLYRQLAETHLAAFRPYVATTLNNLGLLYAETTRLAEAEQTFREALGLYRQLVETHLAAYCPDVANTLNNLTLLEIKTKKYTEACTHLRESLEIREKLVLENPAAFDLDLCETILNMIKLDQAAPGTCIPQETSIPALLNRAIDILKKYPHVPQAQELLKEAEEMKKAQ